MNVLVDTCIWSLALRRSKRNPANPWVAELHALIQEGRATIIGPIRAVFMQGVGRDALTLYRPTVLPR